MCAALVVRPPLASEKGDDGLSEAERQERQRFSDQIVKVLRSMLETLCEKLNHNDVKVAVWAQCKNVHAVDPSVKWVVMKYRSEFTELIGDLARLMPKAKNIFLYRNGQKVNTSMARLLPAELRPMVININIIFLCFVNIQIYIKSPLFRNHASRLH